MNEMKFGRCTLELVRGDITVQDVDAIVNAANSALAGGGGVDGAIHRGGGPTIMRETREKYPDGCPTGFAVASGAGDLKAKYVFHAVGPRWKDGRHNEPELLQSAYRRCMELAAEHDCRSIAFPSISTGVYGFPIEQAAPVALETIQTFLDQNPDSSLKIVRLCLFSEHDLDVYRRVMKRLPVKQEGQRLVLRNPLIRNRYKGCLLGGAVGDALGGAVEFLDRKYIVHKYGEPGIRDYAECYGGKGLITDDTQMTLYTAEGLLRAYVRGSMRGVGHIPSLIASAYQRWLQTQQYGAKPFRDGWLSSHKELCARRAPGNTCLSALKVMRSLGDLAENNSKGCGGVMRVAPVGLFCYAWKDRDSLPDRKDYVEFARSPDSPFELGKAAATITHGHPTGFLTAGMFSSVIYLLLNGLPLREAVLWSLDVLRLHEKHKETLDAVEKALELSEKKTNDPATLTKLGQGWIAEEALAVGFYAALSVVEMDSEPTEKFERGIVLSVNHDGDSDSTGSICGNILGVIYGKSAIPDRWLEPLELRSVIEEIADDLATFRYWGVDAYADSDECRFYCERYPGW